MQSYFIRYIDTIGNEYSQGWYAFNKMQAVREMREQMLLARIIRIANTQDATFSEVAA